MNQYANDFTDNVKIYYKELNKYEHLSKQEEKELILKCRNGDIDARNKLLESNLKFVFDIAKKYSHKQMRLLLGVNRKYLLILFLSILDSCLLYRFQQQHIQ